MLTEYLNDHARELRELEQSRPRYERADARTRSRVREAIRRVALAPASAAPGPSGDLAAVVIRRAGAADGRALARLAEGSERRLPSGLVIVAEVESEVVAALPLRESFVLTDLRRPTGDIVQLLELRSAQLRVAGLEKVA